MTIVSFFKNKKTIICLAVAAGLVLLTSLGLSLFGPWWRIWPPKIEALIAFNRLAVLVYREPYCHQECYFKKTAYRRSLLLALDRAIVLKRLSETVFDESADLNWRLEALKIIAKGRERLKLEFFSRIEAYLFNPAGHLEMKENMILYFQADLNADNLSFYFKNTFMDKTQTNSDRIIVLRTLSRLPLDNSDFYLEVLATETSAEIKNEVLRIIGSRLDDYVHNPSDLSRLLENIIRKSDSNFTLRRLSVFILSAWLDEKREDFLPLFEKLLDSGEIDIFTRYLIVDIFNNYSDQARELPPISPEAWDFYYQQA